MGSSRPLSEADPNSSYFIRSGINTRGYAVRYGQLEDGVSRDLHSAHRWEHFRVISARDDGLGVSARSPALVMATDFVQWSELIFMGHPVLLVGE
jgi:hypothetical protein